MSRKRHLMFEHTPYSACGKYLGNNPGMLQTFKREKASCKNCLKNLNLYKKINRKK